MNQLVAFTDRAPALFAADGARASYRFFEPQPLDTERLKNAPRYDAGEEPFADPAFGQRLGDYYGAR